MRSCGRRLAALPHCLSALNPPSVSHAPMSAPRGLRRTGFSVVSARNRRATWDPFRRETTPSSGCVVCALRGRAVAQSAPALRSGSLRFRQLCGLEGDPAPRAVTASVVGGHFRIDLGHVAVEAAGLPSFVQSRAPATRRAVTHPTPVARIRTSRKSATPAKVTGAQIRVGRSVPSDPWVQVCAEATGLLDASAGAGVAAKAASARPTVTGGIPARPRAKCSRKRIRLGHYALAESSATVKLRDPAGEQDASSSRTATR
jgi:hypothetical protein